MQYFLMHENKKLALIEVDEYNNIVNVAISKNPNTRRYLPFNTYDERTLVKWIKSRGIPITRQGIGKELMLAKVSDTFELLLKNNGLSLTDHYWLNPNGESHTWEDINLYTNDFKAVYSLDICDDISDISSKTNFMPSAALKGDLKKKWIIDKHGIRHLVKGNYNNTCRQNISEVLATNIHCAQGKFQYTPYSLIRIKCEGQKTVGCECPNFTSTQTEFIPAIDIIDSAKKPNDVSYYEFFIRLCMQYGLDLRAFLEYQIMTDFIISNTDRHLNNFGILRDSNTLQWLGYAPIFDSGNSMFYKANYIPVDKALLKLEVTSFFKKRGTVTKIRTA